MLTIKECREILKLDENELSDQHIIEIRDWLMMMADIVLEQVEKEYLKNKNYEDGN